MKTSSFHRTGAALVALSLAAALGAKGVAAQTPAAPAPAAAPAAPPVETPAPAAAIPATAKPAAARPAPGGTTQVEQHISRLHRDLRITPAQGSDWDAFAQVMRDNAQHMDGLYRQRSASLGTMNAVDSLKSYADITQAHVEDLQKLQPAFAKLYGSMSDAQKKTADRLFRSNPSR